MAKNVILADMTEKGDFSLPVSQSEVASVHFADIDLIVTTKSGAHYILPSAALSAMDAKPPQVVFKDSSVGSDKLLSSVATSQDLSLDIQTVSSLPAPQPKELDREKIEQELKQKFERDLDKAHQDLSKTQSRIQNQENLIAKQQKDLDAQKAHLKDLEKQIEDQDDIKEKLEENASHEKIVNAASENNHESSVDKFNEKMAEISNDIHTKDFDYVPLRPYEPPSQVFMGPPGVPAPLSMTPLVTLSMGNVVGTQSSTDGMGITTIYGGGGATGSGAEAKLGPRDPLQFSAATITGTAGDDIIYAQGPLVGNADPSINTDHYAKQFLMKIAGYFTELNDVVFKGLPSFVTVSHATQNADGSWSLPSSYVLTQQAFELTYDKNAARASGTPVFDMTVEVTGMMRGTEFNSVERFRFQFMDVTQASQSTDNLLTYWDDGASKQIYILPTLDQPNIINAGDGNDMVYGSQSHDTIDGGAGNDQIWAYGGNNIVTGGTGNDTISATDGNNDINAGDGTNSITVGNGNNTLTAGTGDDTIITGHGINTINAGNGNNTITVGNGVNTITSGSGNDTITAGDGGNTIYAGDGTNAVTTGAGNDNISSGAGDDTLSGGAGDDIFSAGLGTNIIHGGTGSNTVDYTGIGVAMTISLATGTATGAGVSDTYTDVTNVTGSALGDTITGSTGNNVMHGGAGNDTITGNGGNDTIYGDAGDDTLTGGSSNDVIDGGDGADTIRGGGGTDILRGGAGNDIFLNNTAGTTYEGGDGVDKVDYSGENTNLTIDLASGNGSGGNAQNSTYNSIEWVVGGNRDDRFTGGNADEIFEGGNGNDWFSGGLGNNTLSGGSGTNWYAMGLGRDFVNAVVGAWDELQYGNSTAGVVVNLDNVAHSFVNNLGVTITVNALSGTSRQENANDVNSHSIGDTYSDGGIDYMYGNGNADVFFTSSTKDGGYYAANGGDDLVFGQGRNDRIYLSWGNAKIDGGGGTDYIFTGWSSYNMTIYLDGTADINANGRADYLDKNASILAGSGYTGFGNGWSGTTLLMNFENIRGGQGSDFLVGDNNANEINGDVGSNAIYGLGGNDVIYAMEGNNTIDGGTGTDTVSFIREGIDVGWESPDLGNGMACYLADADLNGDGLMDKANTWGGYSSFNARVEMSGVVTFSTITNVENIHGSVGNDLIAGDANANIIYGNSGNDTITGNGGTDYLYGHAGNDTFVIDPAHMNTFALVDGGTNTDTIISKGWTFAAGSFDGSRYASIETIDVRNNASGGTYGLHALDIQRINDVGASSVLQLQLDSGDTFTPTIGAGTGALTALQTINTATDQQYKFYSDAGHTINNSTNLVAILNIHYGA